MPVELKPETEALIRQEVQRGAYRSASKFIEHAVALLHEQEEWLAENRKGDRGPDGSWLCFVAAR